jgi:hypothetical protein
MAHGKEKDKKRERKDPNCDWLHLCMHCQLAINLASKHLQTIANPNLLGGDGRGDTI